MLKIYNLLMLIFSLFEISAQQLFPVTLSNCGSSKLSGGLLLEDHVGGFMVSTIATPTFMYTQGFIQPDNGSTSVIPFINDVVISSGYGIDNGGSTFIEGNTFLEFSIGEFASKSFINSDKFLTQGLLQPYDSRYWTGLVNTDWTNIFNWSPAFIPTEYDIVIIPPLCPNYPIVVNNIIGNCKKLTAQNGSSVTIDNGGRINVHNN